TAVRSAAKLVPTSRKRRCSVRGAMARARAARASVARPWPISLRMIALVLAATSSSAWSGWFIEASALTDANQARRTERDGAQTSARPSPPIHLCAKTNNLRVSREAPTKPNVVMCQTSDVKCQDVPQIVMLQINDQELRNCICGKFTEMTVYTIISDDLG